MTTEYFVEAIHLWVGESAVDTVNKLLQKPPGRKPDANLVEMAEWFRSLSDHDRAFVLRVAREGIESALFGFFCVLDGVRAIEDIGEKGSFELYFVKHEHRDLLNASDQDMLHDSYNWVRKGKPSAD